MSLLDPIYRSPAMPRLARELESALHDEPRRRQAFRGWLTEDVKAEFINGEKVVHLPARNDHNLATFRVAKLLDAFVARRQMGRVGIEKNLIGLSRNDDEPDVCWWGPEEAATLRGDTRVFPAPDLVVEVLSQSTVATDRGVKFEDYADHGVSEYWIVDVDARVVEQYLLQGERYALQAKWGVGSVLRSAAIGTIEVPVDAVFDDAAHTAALRQVWQG